MTDRRINDLTMTGGIANELAGSQDLPVPGK